MNYSRKSTKIEAILTLKVPKQHVEYVPLRLQLEVPVHIESVITRSVETDSGGRMKASFRHGYKRQEQSRTS